MPPTADNPARFTQPGGAAEPARAAGLSRPGLAKFSYNQSAEQFLDVLVGAGLLEDAVKVMARALPKREAVWWACRCAKEAPRPEGDGPPSDEATKQHAAGVAAEDAARKAAEAWCSGPVDARRRAASEAGQAALDSPSGMAAMSAFFADGSLAPADCPEVPPPPDACAAMVAGAVLLSAVRSEPERADEKRVRFLETAKLVNAGSDRWPDAPPPSPARTTSLPVSGQPIPTKSPPPPPVRRSYY